MYNPPPDYFALFFINSQLFIVKLNSMSYLFVVINNAPPFSKYASLFLKKH